MDQVVVNKTKRKYKKRDPNVLKRKYTKRNITLQPQLQPEIQPAKISLQCEIKPQVHAETQPPLQCETQPTRLSLQCEIQPQIQPPVQPSVQPQAQSNTSLNSKSQNKRNTLKTRKINIKTTPIIIKPEMPKLNDKFIELMDTLGFIMRQQKDLMRARAYANAKETISMYPGDITDPAQLKGMKGIGVTIYQKLIDFHANGTLRIIDENKEIIGKKNIMDRFTDIYGVGEKKAEELIDAGIKSIEELEVRQVDMLNAKQRVGLKYYKDILRRIPRSEIQEYETIFKNALPDASLEIVGSYRRGLDTSGDIDVIITSLDANIFPIFINTMVEQGIIVEILSQGNVKCLVIAKLPNTQYFRRVDFLYATPEEYPFSILYFTGSKEFNTTMREHALSMNYTLNEHGLSVMENRKKGELVKQIFPDEKSIFDFLNLEFKQPTERINGKAVIQTADTKPIKSKGTQKNKKKMVDIRIKVPEIIEAFKKNGINILNSLTEQQLANVVTTANIAFHRDGTPILSDNEYDIIRDYLSSKYPNNPALNDIGAEVVSGRNKIQLPYEMASMDKIKPDTNVIAIWSAKYKGPYEISCKLDGVSGMFSTEGLQPKLYTRGDGKVGQDISAMIPRLKLPKETKNIVIRGEFMIPKAVFREKYADTFANPRNLVAGIVNQKNQDDRVKDLRFLAYEVIKPAGLKPSEQMQLLETINVDVVQHRNIPTISNEYMSEVLQDWRKNYEFEIDGVIVSDDNIHSRETGNPDHSFAFKMVLSDQMAESQVVDVIWTASKDGYLKPRVRIMPVKLGGVTIQYATGFNGAFIRDNMIGIGAIVQIIRSGDVIPKIQSVTTPSVIAKMPEEEYIWNDTNVDVMLQDTTGNIVVLEKNITGFFKGIGVDGMGPGNVDKLIASGFDSIPKILLMQKSDFLKVDGFKDKTATKLVEGIRDKVALASLATIMAKSNQLGRGFSTKRAEQILAEYPTVFETGEQNIAKLVAIDGIEKKSAQAFVSHIPNFLKFMEECGLMDKLTFKNIAIDDSHPLFGKIIVLSGFRDKDIEEKLKAVSAKLGSSVIKNTFALLVKDINETSSKVVDAKKYGVQMMVREEFINKYFTRT